MKFLLGVLLLAVLGMGWLIWDLRCQVADRGPRIESLEAAEANRAEAVRQREAAFAAGEFDDAEVTRLRAQMEAVEAIRRHERWVNEIREQLERLGVDLPPEQKNRVIQATVEYRGRLREMRRQRVEANDDAMRQRHDDMEATRDWYSRLIAETVDPDATETIIAALGH